MSRPLQDGSSAGAEPAVVANFGCALGENPLWNLAEGRVYWVDIDTGRLFRAEPGGLRSECFYRGEAVGGFTFQANGKLLLFEADRIAELDPQSGSRRVLLDGIDSDMVRFNDVIADPEGRVFAGTIGRSSESGGLYRIELDGSVDCLWKGTGCANGSGFTPDLSGFYWTCTTHRTVYVANYDRETGKLSDRRPFWNARNMEGAPDGLTVDAAGSVWSALWGGSCVVRLDGAAEVLERIVLPVPKVTSLTFGGADLDTLFITTAGGQLGSPKADGTLYAIATEARGRVEFQSKIRL